MHVRQAHYRYINGKRVYVRSALVHVKRAKRTEYKNGTCYETICPDCGQTCFYYCSKKGGSTWFSALGRPWPKHPCVTIGKGFGAAPSEEGRDLFEDIESLPDE